MEIRTVQELRDYLNNLLEENGDMDVIMWSDSGEDTQFPALLKTENLKVGSNNNLESGCLTEDIDRRYIQYPKALNIFSVSPHDEDEESIIDI